MVLRETTFLVGGALTIALGVLLGVGLLVAGAGLLLFDAWLGAGLGIGLGSFFIHVGRAEARDRRTRLNELEAGRSGPTEPPGAGG